MKEIIRKRRIARLLYSRYTILVLVVLIVFMGKGVWGAYGKYKKSKTAYEITYAELEDLESRDKVLDQNLAVLRTPFGEDREIREKFGFVKEGEKLIILVEDKDGEDDVSAKEPWWRKVIDIFTR